MDVTNFLTPEGHATLSKVSGLAAKAIELLDGSFRYPVDFTVRNDQFGFPLSEEKMQRLKNRSKATLGQ